MRVVSFLIALSIVSAITVYCVSNLFLHYSGALVDASEPAKLSVIIPPLLAIVGTVITALVSGGVALVNWLAQRDLAAVQSEYAHDLEGAKLRFMRQLEARKKELSAELEREKAQLDVLKSEVVRNLALFQRSVNVVGRYGCTISRLRRGEFDVDTIEASEIEMRVLITEFDRNEAPFVDLQKLLTQGIYIKERAERKSSPQGYKDLWAERSDGVQVGTVFARLEENALIAIRNAREACLAVNALTGSQDLK